MSEISKEKRAKIAVRVRALLQMTESKGCTEAEALAAAEKAGELMTEYALAAEDLADIKDEKFGFRRRPGYCHMNGSRKHYHEVLRCTHAISVFFDCKHYWQVATTELTYFGSQLDTELAHHITARIKRTMEIEWELFKKLPAYHIDRLKGIHPKTIRTNFMYAFADRVNRRLYELKGTQRELLASSSAQALVVCKEGIIKEKFQEAHPEKIKSRTIRTKVAQLSPSALAAGEAAGKRVSLDTNVSRPGDQQKRIA